MNSLVELLILLISVTYAVADVDSKDRIADGSHSETQRDSRFVPVFIIACLLFVVIMGCVTCAVLCQRFSPRTEHLMKLEHMESHHTAVDNPFFHYEVASAAETTTHHNKVGSTKTGVNPVFRFDSKIEKVDEKPSTESAVVEPPMTEPLESIQVDPPKEQPTE